MQRGIIFLNKSEASLALEIVQQNQLSLAGFASLLSKLELATKSPQETSQIEVTVEEVETLLDLLPPPTAGQNELIRNLRQSLNTFFKKN